MPFKDEILAGEQLIRTAIRSENYVMPPQSPTGWRIARNGDVEFNNALIRGSFATGPPAPYVAIEDGSSDIDFYSGHPSATGPGSVGVTTAEYLRLLSPSLFGETQSVLLLSPGTASFPGNILGGPEVAADFNLSALGHLRAGLLDTAEVSDASSRTTAGTGFTHIAGSTLTASIRWPSSYTILVYGWALISNSVASGQQGIMSCEVRDANAAGTVLLAASDINAARCDGSAFQSASFLRVLKIPAAQPMLSGTLFARAMYRSTNAGNTANFGQGFLAMVALPNAGP